MFNLALPPQPTNVIELADWMEMFAILSTDQNASRGDLDRALRAAALFGIDEDQQLTQLVMEVLSELDDRARGCGDAYPFNLDPAYVLQTRGAWEDYSIYIFCLCLSFFGWESGTGYSSPAKLFEVISALALKNYISGEVLIFGHPRLDLPTAFDEAVNHLCTCIGEGEEYFGSRSSEQKDGHLDIVGWRKFADDRVSKLIVFGQCATGRNWRTKDRELSASAFCQQWMRRQPVSPIVEAFFLPMRIGANTWEMQGRRSGIVFDRCRIAYWAHIQATDESYDLEPFRAWVRQKLRQIT